MDRDFKNKNDNNESGGAASASGFNGKIINWYPGHMAKAGRTLEENLKLVNVVIELCDARLPFSSRNPKIDKIIGNKPRILVFNKADLADRSVSDHWMNYYVSKGYTVVFTDSKSGDGVKKVVKAVKDVMEEKIQRSREKGRVLTTIYCMVVGIPNVGKSSFVNRVTGRSAAATGDKPGVTREKQWLKMDDSVYLLDTPGLLWPRIENQMSAMRLAACGAIKDEVVDTGELAAFLLDFVEEKYPGALKARYGIDPDSIKVEEEPDYVTGSVLGDEKLRRGLALLEACGRSRGCLVKGGEVDLSRAAAIVLDEYRGGKLGAISLDHPGVIEEDEQIMLRNRENDEMKRRKRTERKASYRRKKK